MAADFLVIGAGVIGCATALELAEAGVSVRVLERGRLCGEASWAGAGLLAPLPPWGYLPPVSALAASGMARFAEWVRGLEALSGVDTEYVKSGLLVLPPYDADAARHFAAAQRMALAEVPARLVAPALAWHGRALWLPEVAQVRNPRLARALRGALAARGVTVEEGVEAIAIEVEGDAVAVWTAAGERFSAGQVVVCAGAWSARLLGSLGTGLGIVPVRGQMLLYAPEGGRAPGGLTALVAADDVYLVPRRDGHLLVGSTLEYAGFDKATSEEAHAFLSVRAAALLPALEKREPIAQWAGLRPGRADNVPIIDRHPSHPRLWLNAGHFRYGVTMAPAAARLLADLVLGRTPLLDPTPYAWPQDGASAADELGRGFYSPSPRR